MGVFHALPFLFKIHFENIHVLLIAAMSKIGINVTNNTAVKLMIKYGKNNRVAFAWELHFVNFLVMLMLSHG